ncbi:MAG: (S)-ureidoglycine aminohydrolase [Limisphaerales bacterium]
MIPLFGQTRDVVKERYALRTPSGFVPSVLPGWRNVVPIVQISPGMGSDFAQIQITFDKNGEGRGNTGVNQYLVYVLEGKCVANLAGKKNALRVGSYAYVPSQTDFHFTQANAGTKLLIFEKKFVPLAGYDKPAILVGHETDIQGQPFLGNKDARLQVLLPDHPSFDMAVNIFTYQPGATLPFVEVHIMEHGLLMLKGQGVYRLDADWYPVCAGDVIWMKSYCPQWFVAMGTTPASYIYYKDVNRAALP